MLAAPPTEVRQEIKRLANESLWTELLEAVETAMGEAYGRAWLDLQRYVWKACYEQGSYYDPISTAVRSELRALLADHPTLTEMTLAGRYPHRQRRDCRLDQGICNGRCGAIPGAGVGATAKLRRVRRRRNRSAA